MGFKNEIGLRNSASQKCIEKKSGISIVASVMFSNTKCTTSVHAKAISQLPPKVPRKKNTNRNAVVPPPMRHIAPKNSATSQKGAIRTTETYCCRTLPPPLLPPPASPLPKSHLGPASVT